MYIIILGMFFGFILYMYFFLEFIVDCLVDCLVLLSLVNGGDRFF